MNTTTHIISLIEYLHVSKPYANRGGMNNAPYHRALTAYNDYIASGVLKEIKCSADITIYSFCGVHYEVMKRHGVRRKDGRNRELKPAFKRVIELYLNNLMRGK